MPTMRPIGTCEHIWGDWEFESVSFGCTRGTYRMRFHRVCDLCYGHQVAADDADKRRMERLALEEVLRPAAR